MELDEITQIKVWGRIRHALKAAWHILANRPIICVFDDASIFARSNPAYMHVAAQALAEAAEQVTAEQILDGFRELVEIPDHRKN